MQYANNASQQPYSNTPPTQYPPFISFKISLSTGLPLSIALSPILTLLAGSFLLSFPPAPLTFPSPLTGESSSTTGFLADDPTTLVVGDVPSTFTGVVDPPPPF